MQVGDIRCFCSDYCLDSDTPRVPYSPDLKQWRLRFAEAVVKGVVHIGTGPARLAYLCLAHTEDLPG